MREVNVIVDSCDIDNDGHCVGPLISCLDCRTTELSRYSANWNRGTMELVSGCCLEKIAEVR